MTDAASAVAPSAPSSHRRAAQRWLLGTGTAVAAWGVFALWKAFEIDQPTAFRPMGPRVFPVAISVGLIVVGVAFVVQVWRRGDEYLQTHVETELETTEPRQAAAVLAVLIAYAAAFRPVGYVVATALFLPAVAWILGSRQLLRDAVVAIAIAIGAFMVFTHLLNIDLPTGVLGDLL